MITDMIPSVMIREAAGKEAKAGLGMLDLTFV